MTQANIILALLWIILIRGLIALYFDFDRFCDWIERRLEAWLEAERGGGT